MSTIRIPTPLRQFAGGNTSIPVSGETVDAALQNLTQTYPDLKEHLYDGEKLRSFVNIYLNQEDIRYLDGEDTAIAPNDKLMIVPSIAGG
jgi:molybdopterin converting factor small subunit